MVHVVELRIQNGLVIVHHFCPPVFIQFGVLNELSGKEFIRRFFGAKLLTLQQFSRRWIIFVCMFLM